MTSNPNEFGTSPQSRGGASPSINLIDEDVEDLSKIVTSLNGTTKGGDRLAFLLHNVLTPSQCDALIKRSEGIGYETALLNIGGGRQVVNDDVRNSGRCIIDDPDIAAFLYERILAKLEKNHPEMLQNLVNFKRLDQQFAVGLNERLRILRYDPDCYFKPHSDGCYVRRNEAGPMRRGETSRVTILLYLNEGYRGGLTKLRSCWDANLGRGITPRTGDVLLFEHECLHEGTMLEEGRKYVVRTDLMYTNKGRGHEYSNVGLYEGAETVAMDLDE
jgi:hypothetical protein